MSNTEAERIADEWGGMVPVDCPNGHVIAIDDGDGTVYACPACALAAADEREARVRALLDGAPAAHGYVLASDLRAALDG